MTREEVIDRLRPCESELRASGLGALYLFGSTARNEAGSDSDVDLLYEPDRPSFGLMHEAVVQDRLAALLDAKVDLVDRHSLRPRVRTRVERDLVRVF